MELTMRNEIVKPVLTALTAATDTAIPFDGRDDQMVIVINASADTTVTVKAGNHIQGVADMTVTVPTGISLIKLESGRFKHVSGENKGKIVLNAAKAVSVGVAALV